jgi:hypothetical protein
VVNLVDASGNMAASYTYDTWGNVTSASERIPTAAGGWSNPYRYDGRTGVRYDASDGLYWLAVPVHSPATDGALTRTKRAGTRTAGGTPIALQSHWA